MLLFLAACFPEVDKDTAFDSGVDSDPTFDSEPLPADDTGETGPIDEDGDGSPAGEDCNDGDADVYPGASEVCDGVDQDCDDEVDEDLTELQYPDADGDGYGRNGDSAYMCPDEPGFSDETGDCDDTDATIHPGATDTRDGIDQDCDGEYDEDAGPNMIEVTVDWSSRGIELTIKGSPSSYDFGMAETGAGSLGWYGETCIPGDEPGGVEDYGYDLCHYMDGTGGSLPSVTSIGDVSDENTLFNETIGDRGDITYILADIATLDCWVWGDDPSYYADYACTEL